MACNPAIFAPDKELEVGARDATRSTSVGRRSHDEGLVYCFEEVGRNPRGKQS